MGEHLYSLNSILIAIVLFVSMLGAIALGHRVGRRRTDATETERKQVNAIQGSMLGLLALVLGFTFSLALERYDQRQEALMKEAAAINTAAMRSSLLPSGGGPEAMALLRAYLDERVAEGRITLAEDGERRAALRRCRDAGQRLCEFARQAVERDDSPVRTGLFVQSVNDLLDSFAGRESVLERHVPETALLLLFLIMLLTGAAVGFASGIGGHRPPSLTLALTLLLVLVTFLVIDLDRPRRGLIQLPHNSLVDLQTDLQSATAPTGRR